MEIPADRWYKALQTRRSRRNFMPQKLDSEALAKLNELSLALTALVPGGKTAIVTHSPSEAFKGALGSYGKVKGAPAYAAFIADSNNPHLQENIGYLGEAFILEATALGFATCWIGGFFKPEVVARHIKLKADEVVLAITPLGFAPTDYSWEEKIMSGFASSHKRKDLAHLCTGLPEKEWPTWARTALAAARLAPSAINRQPWRFQVAPQQITVFNHLTKDLAHVSPRLDCGIAMLHLEVGALCSGVRGSWEYLEGPGVAKFTVKNM